MSPAPMRCAGCLRSNVIGHVKRDYVQFWECLDCHHSWNRWSEGHPFFGRANNFMNDYRLNQRGTE